MDPGKEPDSETARKERTRAGTPPGSTYRTAPVDPLIARRKALAAFAALSNGDRLDLIRLLFPAGDEGLAAGDIARRLGLSASRLSFHLSQLEQAGLLRARKVARNVFYMVDPGGLGTTIAYLLSDCCGEHPEVIACCRHDGLDLRHADEDRAMQPDSGIGDAAPSDDIVSGRALNDRSINDQEA